MALAFVLDEHFRGPLWNAIERHNLGSEYLIDAVRVGDPPDLPLRTTDPTLLLWAEREDRIIISKDKRTMPIHLDDHLRAGHHVPGVFIVRTEFSNSEIVEYLELDAYAGDPAEFRDTVTFIP